MTTLPFDQFEQAYERLAQAIDEAGPDQERLFLTKLALALAHQLNSLDLFETAVSMALQDLSAVKSDAHLDV